MICPAGENRSKNLPFSVFKFKSCLDDEKRVADWVETNMKGDYVLCFKQNA